jgi:hypothetical protein
MGQHDPLDGFITYNELQETTPKDKEWSNLNVEIVDMTDICKGRNWTTDDPLGIGGMLCDAYKVAHLLVIGHIKLADLLLNLLKSSYVGLEFYIKGNPLESPAKWRLAFRELGLSLGLHAIERLRRLIDNKIDFLDVGTLRSRIENLMRYIELGKQIEDFWLESKNRETDSWKVHRDINMVMLATSLVPDGYLSF